MTANSTVRRHANGVIDIDFYRGRATELRRQAIRDARTMPIAWTGVLVMAGALGFALVVPSTATIAREQIASTWPTLPLTR